MIDDETVPVDSQEVVDFWRYRQVKLAEQLDINGISYLESAEDLAT